MYFLTIHAYLSHKSINSLSGLAHNRMLVIVAMCFIARWASEASATQWRPLWCFYKLPLAISFPETDKRDRYTYHIRGKRPAGKQLVGNGCQDFTLSWKDYKLRSGLALRESFAVGESVVGIDVILRISTTRLSNVMLSGQEDDMLVWTVLETTEALTGRMLTVEEGGRVLSHSPFLPPTSLTFIENSLLKEPVTCYHSVNITKIVTLNFEFNWLSKWQTPFHFLSAKGQDEPIARCCFTSCQVFDLHPIGPGYGIIWAHEIKPL